MAMPEQGTVKWFNDAKGYGFIVRERGTDVFVHEASIVAEGSRTLNDGDRVSFEVVEGPKGLMAKNVVKIS
jgi:cold shock protein